ncbi:hypothetical protein EKH55_4629 [Sinorhizobium alkalisoli]|nr:hypothetical protein EKH55_4629 [Sinorhizobium alkalisoli]
MWATIFLSFAGGRSYRWIARDLAISKRTIADVVARDRAGAE